MYKDSRQFYINLTPNKNRSRDWILCHIKSLVSCWANYRRANYTRRLCVNTRNSVPRVSQAGYAHTVYRADNSMIRSAITNMSAGTPCIYKWNNPLFVNPNLGSDSHVSEEGCDQARLEPDAQRIPVCPSTGVDGQEIHRVSCPQRHVAV